MENMLVFFLVGILVIGGLLIGIIALTRRTPKSLHKEKYQADWLTIESSIGDGTGSWQLAVLNADKLLDRALKERGFKGQTMGERMASASRSFSKCDTVWAAHKLRNRIAHEENVKLSANITRQALVGIKQGLKDLGAL